MPESPYHLRTESSFEQQRDGLYSIYWNFLNAAPASSPADSILLNSQIVVLWAPSLKWAIWGERDSGLCVLASTPAMTPPSWKGRDWLRSLHPSAERACFSQRVGQQFSRIPSL